VADAGGQHLEQNFRALRFGVGCSLSCKGWPQTQTWNMRILVSSRLPVLSE
jgi:hypothetical protein